MGAVLRFVPQIVNEDHKYIGYLSEWTLDIDGEKEDCIAETYEHFRKYKPGIVLG